jgi:prepilin-type processing-associated H-X9-DG protein
MHKVWVLALLLGAVCLVGLCLGGEVVFATGFYLTFGWVLFLYRVFPQITVDLTATITSVVCLIGLAFGLHQFLRWFYRMSEARKTAEASTASQWRLSWTGMLLALVIMMFVAGISAVGIAHQTAWLFSAPNSFTHIHLGIREVAYDVQSANNLKLFGKGLQDYDETRGSLPPGGTFDQQGNGLHGWQTFLLPYIEQTTLYATIDLHIAWNDPRNAQSFRAMVKSYLHPAGGENQNDAGFALSHYAANVRLMGGGKPWSLGNIPGSASNTILAGEVRTAYKPWGHPTNWRDPALGINTSQDSFGSPVHSDRAQFLMADGSVRSVTNKVSLATLKAVSTPDGGEQIGSDW